MDIVRIVQIIIITWFVLFGVITLAPSASLLLEVMTASTPKIESPPSPPAAPSALPLNLDCTLKKDSVGAQQTPPTPPSKPEMETECVDYQIRKYSEQVAEYQKTTASYTATVTAYNTTFANAEDKRLNIYQKVAKEGLFTLFDKVLIAFLAFAFARGAQTFLRGYFKQRETDKALQEN